MDNRTVVTKQAAHVGRGWSRWNDGWLVLLVVLLCGASAPALAVRYELTRGAQFALCRDYVAALNAAQRPLPVACERHFPPAFKQFRQIRWEPLDPKAQDMELYRQMFYVSNYGKRHYQPVNEADWESAKKGLVGKLDSGSVQLARARLDIDADGKRETVYRIALFPCSDTTREDFEKRAAPFSDYKYYVVDEKTGRLDERYWTITGNSGLMPFYYKGKVFFDAFSGLSVEMIAEMAKQFNRPETAPDGYLYVSEPSGGQELFRWEQVCEVEVYYELDGKNMEKREGVK